ncbi:MAG: hypothetical protein PWQ88_302 [Candidatus Methanomethylophilaceae archaeon]|nr:hypothetical protein [Candidatus Methanomethylophilaceae archaeon]MDI3542014.1 hypothetical protein [Candidatus Methanomethylophilaceae archaeon]HIJ00864.1 hypothetical protein [Candidatus Methanomethylophilaceae archaeon]
MTEEKEYIPTALAADIQGAFDFPVAGEEAAKVFSTFISDLVKASVKAGAWSIGHIKAVVESGAGFLMLSSTTENGKVRCRGELNRVEDYSMTVNVIVYGADPLRLEEMFVALVETLPHAQVDIIPAEGCDDPNCFDPFCHRHDHMHKDY